MLKIGGSQSSFYIIVSLYFAQVDQANDLCWLCRKWYVLLLNHIEPLAMITVINLDLGIHLLKKRLHHKWFMVQNSFVMNSSKESETVDLIITNLDTTNHAVL